MIFEKKSSTFIKKSENGSMLKLNIIFRGENFQIFFIFIKISMKNFRKFSISKFFIFIKIWIDIFEIFEIEKK